MIETIKGCPRYGYKFKLEDIIEILKSDIKISK